MSLRSATGFLLILALGLPAGEALLFWVSGLLTAMGDSAGAGVIGHINTALGVLWLLSLLALLIVLGLRSLVEDREPPAE